MKTIRVIIKYEGGEYIREVDAISPGSAAFKVKSNFKKEHPEITEIRYRTERI